MKTLEQALAAFDPKTLRSAVSVCNALKLHGYEIEDLEDYFKEVRKAEELSQEEWKIEVERQMKEWQDVAPLCPTCGGFLNPPRHICKRKGPENLFGYTCLWHCENGDCIYERYTFEDAGEELEKLMKKKGRKEQCH